MTKKLLAAIFAVVLMAGTVSASIMSGFTAKAHDASVGIYLVTSKGRGQICSGTSIKSPSKDYGLVLTARHCVADLDTNEIYAKKAGHPEEVSFSDDERGPYYTTSIEAISDDEDYALLRVNNSEKIPYVELGDSKKLEVGDSIFSWSFPSDAGKLYAIGRVMSSGGKYPHFPGILAKDYSVWRNAYPADITIAHGSSGSGIFDSEQQKLVGVLVGAFPDGMKIVMPTSGAEALIKKHKTVAQWEKEHPVVAPPDFDFDED